VACFLLVTGFSPVVTGPFNEEKGLPAVKLVSGSPH
jgi:hypothetical protein